MKLHRASTPVVPPTVSTPQIVAHPLAFQRARGVAVLVFAATLAGLAGWLAANVDAWLALVALPCIPLAVYGWDALANVKLERRKFYAIETQRNEDLDGDGIIGDPVGHVVHVQGKPAFSLPNLEPSRGPEPIRPLTGFRIPPNDVLFVLDRASQAGLSFRAWEGKVLPSRIKLDRAGVVALQDGMLTWQFATERQTTTGRVVEVSRSETADEMKARVQQGAQP